MLTLGVWGATTEGSPPDDPLTQTRPSLPPGVQAGDYVRAVVKLYSEGKQSQAGPYLKAAQDFRDLLSPEEQATLDQYSQAMTAGSTGQPSAAVMVPGGAAPESSTRQRAIGLVASARAALNAGQIEQARQLAQEAQSLSAPFAAEEDNPARVLADIEKVAGGGVGLGGRNTSPDPKQQAAWLLKSAREQIRLGQLDVAANLVAQAKAIDVRWTLFDDTPAKVEADLEKARAKAPAVQPVTADQATVGDRKVGKQKLKDARAALDAGDYDRAEAIAREVESWGLHFTVLEDSPEKILAATRAVRGREQARRNAQSPANSEVYGSLVTEARQMLSQGRMDEAEARAIQAQQLGVVPPVTADRAEEVLHDIAMMRARGNSAPAQVGAEPASVAVEREANQLLSQSQFDAAAAKFAEAEKLRAQEAGLPPELATASIGTAPAAVDPGIRRTDGGPEAPADLAPLGANPGQEPAPMPLGEPSPVVDALAEARALLASGNYAAARQAAQQAKDGGAGIEAENLLAQIVATQQQAAVSLYEAALDGIRKGDIARSRALLMELSTSDLDEATAQKVQDLLMKLPGDDAGKAQVGVGTVEDAETIKAMQMNAEVGTKVAEARRLMETDPAEAIRVLESSLAAVKAAGQAVQAQLNSIGAQVMPRIGDVLQTLSSPLNGQFNAIDQWIIANTPLDDIVSLYTKYMSPYLNSVAYELQSTLFLGDEMAGFAKLGSFANELAPAFPKVEVAVEGAAAAAPKLSSSVGGVAAGLGKAVPLGSGLSVPVSWTSATAQAGSGVTAIGNATSISAAAEGAVGGNMPVAPPFAQFVNAGNGRRTPAYGHRLTFMTRPPAAG